MDGAGLLVPEVLALVMEKLEVVAVARDRCSWWFLPHGSTSMTAREIRALHTVSIEDESVSGHDIIFVQ